MEHASIGVKSITSGILQAETGTLHFSASALVRANHDGLIDWDTLGVLIGRCVQAARDAEERDAA